MNSRFVSSVGILALLGLALALPASAAFDFGSSGTNSEVSYTIEPVIGFEHVQKVAPTPHSRNRMIYGLRARAGIPLVSLEAEATRGSDLELFPNDDLKIRDQDDRLKIGLVSTRYLGSLFSFSLRAGAQATRNLHEETRAGVTTVTKSGPTYHPYAGTGITSRLGNNFDLAAGVTVIFNDFPHMSKNEYQTTLGFNLRYP
ncbi:MAG: hypothetical protein NDJ90_13245 [Oligoflexia bacterium]|nr:hypothetical protein [Oligoflexia bacterium]